MQETGLAMVKRVFAVNIAVEDLDAAVTKYSAVFAATPQPHPPFAFPGLKGMSLRVGNVMVNLIASDQPNTNIARFLEARGEGLFSISLEVSDIGEAMRELVEKGVEFVSGRPVDFVSGKMNFARPRSTHGVQIAFAQHEPGKQPLLREP